MPRAPSTPPGVAERLQKFLAQRGVASRRGVEEWIRTQRLTVNGRIAELGQKVTEADDIRLDGRSIKVRASAEAHTFIFNRSPGDPLRESTAERAALIERLPRNAGKRFIAVSPMPGVDGGLELVTSDGALAEKLQRCVHKLPIEFTVRVRGLLGPDQLEGIRSGKLDRPARIAIDKLDFSEADLEGANRWYSLTARGASGKDVRQLFERQGALLSRVVRVRIGTLTLEKSLMRGQFRALDEDEIAALQKPAPTAQPGP